MSILILGGTRLTGPFTVRALVERGHKVTVFHRGQQQAELPDSVQRIIGRCREQDDYRDQSCLASNIFQARS